MVIAKDRMYGVPNETRTHKEWSTSHVRYNTMQGTIIFTIIIIISSSSSSIY